MRARVEGRAGEKVSIDKTLYATLVYTTRGSEESFFGAVSVYRGPIILP